MGSPQGIAAPGETRAQLESVVAGAAVSYSVRFGSNEFAEELFAICPPTTPFVNVKASEVYQAAHRLAAKGEQIDVPSIGLEMQGRKPLCTGPELSDMVMNEWHTREGAKKAARKIVEQEHKEAAAKKLAAAQALLTSDMPPDVAQQYINEALLALGGIESTKSKHPLDLEVSALSAERFIPPSPPFEWLLQFSLLKNELGLIIGPPGAGKSFLSLYFAICLAAGLPILDAWKPGQGPIPCLLISAEDSEQVLWRRFHHIISSLGLSEEEKLAVAARVFIAPVSGSVAFFRRDVKTDSAKHVRRLIKETGAKLVILDNVARFYGGDENDNCAATLFCEELENLAAEYSTNILALHHTNKGSGDTQDDEKALADALKQGALRGASAFAGAARWMLNLAPIGAQLATKLFGKSAAPGTFIALRVSKKNSGSPEVRHYLERREHGLLYPVEAIENPKDNADDAAIALIIGEVQRREAAGEAPLSKVRGVMDVLGCGQGRAKRLIDNALNQEILSISGREAKGGGEGLCLGNCYGVTGVNGDSVTDWMSNYDN